MPSNPVLKEGVFSSAEPLNLAADQVMTIEGTTNKTFLMLFLVLLGALFVWRDPAANMMLGFVALIAGFILSLVISFKHTTAPYLAPVYALAEGVVLGMISSMFNKSYPGIVTQAVFCTFCVFFVLLAAYRAGFIKATPLFTKIMIGAIGAIMLVYLVNMVMGFFGHSLGFVQGNGTSAIIFSVLVAGVAAFSLVMDFAFIEEGVKAGAPKYMEWYGAFALMVTLIWLYIEILKLLSKLYSRRD